MPRILNAFVVAGVLATGARAAPDAPEVESELRKPAAALGVKAGLIPPVAVAPELVVHFPHVLLGAFGIYTGGGPGRGGNRQTMGCELGLELNPPDSSTPYLMGSYFHYQASPDASGYYERTDAALLTAGYEAKWKHFELQFGLGALFVLNEELPPCSGWICIRIMPPVLPALDFSARYRF